MVFDAVFNRISVISLRPVHLSMLSWGAFNQYSAKYYLQSINYRQSSERILGKSMIEPATSCSQVRLSYGVQLLETMLEKEKSYKPSFSPFSRDVFKSQSPRDYENRCLFREQFILLKLKKTRQKLTIYHIIPSSNEEEVF